MGPDPDTNGDGVLCFGSALSDARRDSLLLYELIEWLAEPGAQNPSPTYISRGRKSGAKQPCFLQGGAGHAAEPGELHYPPNDRSLHESVLWLLP